MAAKENSITGKNAMITGPADVKHKDKYFSIVTVQHFHTKDITLLSDYFIPRCTHYFLFTFGQTRDFASSNSIQFFEYNRGALVGQKVLVRSQRQSFFLRYAQLVFWFTIFAMRFVPRRSWIVTPHPPVCFFGKALRALKRHEFVLILADIFQYDSNRLSGVLFNRYIRRCARTIDHVLYMSPDIQRRHDVFAKGERKPRVRKIWSLGIRRRFDESELTKKAVCLRDAATTVIGYVGVVRSCVGLENLIEYARHEPNVRLDIVGEGSYAEELMKRCEDANLKTRVIFHGFLATDDLRVLAKDWICGTMLYDTAGDLYSRHTEPGKAKLYISLGLPVLMTDITYIADEIRQHKAGVVIPSSDPALVAGAIKELRRDYAEYVKGVVAMAEAYDYQRKYDDDFSFMEQLPD